MSAKAYLRRLISMEIPMNDRIAGASTRPTMQESVRHAISLPPLRESLAA